MMVPGIMAVRITVNYEGVERILEFDASRVTIGRPGDTEEPDADLSPDTQVSRQHAVLEVKKGVFWLTDAGSRSGTRVNGREIRGQGEWRLWPEDLVQAGQTRLRITNAGGGKPVVSVPSSHQPQPAPRPPAGGTRRSAAPPQLPPDPVPPRQSAGVTLHFPAPPQPPPPRGTAVNVNGSVLGIA